MATEQDWAAYSDQAFLAETDTLLARTSSGAGVEVAGQHIFARRTSSGPYQLGTQDGIRVTWGAGGITRLQIGSALTTETTAELRYNRTTSEILLSSGVTGSTLTDQLAVTAFATRPGTDNARTLGESSFRWSTVFAATGTINTSDEREKEWRGAISDAELRAAKRITAELGFYRWRDAIAEKGDDARYHFGARAQAVWRIMAQEGLVDPIRDDETPGRTAYAFLCYDQWEGGNRYGLRTDQLALFLIAAQDQRIRAIEAAVGMAS